MAVFDNLNLSTSAGVAPSVVEYHNRSLLKNVKPQLVHQRDMQVRPLPKHNGRRVQFRRPVPFAAVTKPLSEGVTPAGQTLTMTEVWGTIKPYGAHVELTDEINWALLDDMHRVANEELADQAALTLDTLARDALNSGLNVQYAGGKTSRAAITNTDVLTYNELKKAVTSLKKRNVKKFADGFYHAIVDPETVFDLTADQKWIDVATYQDKRKIETGELGCMAGVKFFESTNAKVFTAESYVYGTVAAITASANYVAGSKKIVTSTAFTDADAREMSGKMVYVQYTKSSTNYVFPACIESADVATKTIRLSYEANAATIAEWTTAQALKIVPMGAGASGIGVHSTIVYGQDFAGCVSLDGNGQNIEAIIKPVGSSGALDPLNQRGTLAWKVKGVCYMILQDAFGVRIEHGTGA